MSPSEIIQMLGVVAGPSGAAWLGVKTALNGTRKSIANLSAKQALDNSTLAVKVDTLGRDLTKVREDVGYLKGKVESAL